jgi:hypothetical protein
MLRRTYELQINVEFLKIVGNKKLWMSVFLDVFNNPLLLQNKLGINKLYYEN